METLLLNFLSLDKNTKKFMNFQLQNYLSIFTFLTYFVKKLTLNAYKKNCD